MAIWGYNIAPRSSQGRRKQEEKRRKDNRNSRNPEYSHPAPAASPQPRYNHPQNKAYYSMIAAYHSYMSGYDYQKFETVQSNLNG
jgi:hypothetical protein